MSSEIPEEIEEEIPLEIGRIACVATDLHNGDLVTIVDIIDQNTVLIEGPGCTDRTGWCYSLQVPRKQMKLSDLYLTKFLIDFPAGSSSEIVHKAWRDADIANRFLTKIWMGLKYETRIKS